MTAIGRCRGCSARGAAGFLVWIIARSVQAAPAAQIWSLAAIVVAGVAVLLAARFGLR